MQEACSGKNTPKARVIEFWKPPRSILSIGARLPCHRMPQGTTGARHSPGLQAADKITKIYGKPFIFPLNSTTHRLIESSSFEAWRQRRQPVNLDSKRTGKYK